MTRIKIAHNDIPVEISEALMLFGSDTMWIYFSVLYICI